MMATMNLDLGALISGSASWSALFDSLRTGVRRSNSSATASYCHAIIIAACLIILFSTTASAELSLTESPRSDDFILSSDGQAAAVFVEPSEDRAVSRAAGDLMNDIERASGTKPEAISNSSGKKTLIIIGTLGKSKIIEGLAASGKLETNGVAGQWESYVLQIVKKPLPGVDSALVIAGSDRRGTIFGIYELSELIGVSPWNWWADVPVKQRKLLALCGHIRKQGPPAVKYRGIFLNDEDWGLRPWASKTFEPETGNIGPKTYAKIFELLVRLRANYIWPAMHPGTPAFNSFPTNKELADTYSIVMGSSHCEQMLRDNVDEWKTDVNGEYNYVVNRNGVLKFWEQRVRENGKFDNVYTLGMRGIHDGAMPGGGTEREKAGRLHHIIADQRDLLARWVNTNVAQVPQIFCPYKEVLPLYRLAPDIPDDITIVWPDDNYGYVRQFSNERERRRSGGAGVYYHVSYWGSPRDYLWLCSTPPALIAEEMSKAFDYGADKVWILNVGDLKPAELDIEFFLKLAWNPHAWNGTNTYDLFKKQITRDFGSANAAELSSILAEYYRLNFQRKPEHMGFDLTNTFSTTLNGDEVQRRLDAWRALARRVDAVEKQLPPESHDAFIELVGYPVRAAALINEKALALMKFSAGADDGHFAEQAQQAENEIEQETGVYNSVIAGGKWRGMMSSNPRGQVDFKIPMKMQKTQVVASAPNSIETNATGSADFVERDHYVVMEAEHATSFVPGNEAKWRVIRGLGYNGEAVSVFPTTAPVRTTPEQIRAGSPCLKFTVWLRTPGEWKVAVRALPTFSVEAAKPQRFAVAWDDAPPKIISLPVSQSERDPKWQENVLRNFAEAADTNSITQPGLHTLNVWMVDPGIVIDEIIASTGGAREAGYLGPAETPASTLKQRLQAN
jgi:hypothetical protein